MGCVCVWGGLIKRDRENQSGELFYTFKMIENSLIK